MKKLVFLIVLAASTAWSFAQYSGNKLPSGLTVTTSMAANDYQIVQKTGESYVKAIKAYHAYLYYKKMLDSIVNLSISGDLSVGDATTLNGGLAVTGFSNFGQSANFYGTIGANNKVYFTDSVYMFDQTYLPSYGYAMVLDTTDNIVKLAPMSDGKLKNVCYVNTDLAVNHPNNRRFKNYADAYSYILTQGTPSDANRWTVIVAGFIDDTVQVKPFVSIFGYPNARIRTVVSTVISTGDNIYDAYMWGVTIDTLLIEKNTISSLTECVVNTIQPVGDDDGYLFADNCEFYGGDFSKALSLKPLKSCDFIDLNDTISGLNKITIDGCFIGSYLNEITSLPHDCTNSEINIKNAISVDVATTLINCKTRIDNITLYDNFNITGGSHEFANVTIADTDSIEIYNSRITTDTITLNAKSSFRTCLSTISGLIFANDTAKLEFYNSIAFNNIDITDTSTLFIYGGSKFNGTVTKNNNAVINDDRYTFGEIYYSDASTPQSIPTGVTYTKWTAFATNGASSNVTNDAANDKIILTEAGIYQVTGNFSTSCDTDSVLLHTALFVNGTEKANIHKYETFLNQNNSQSGVVSGIITITTAGLPAELDIRVRHDNGGSVNFTGVYGNLSVVKIGEY